MSDKIKKTDAEWDVSRAKNGKVKLLNHASMELEITYNPADPSGPALAGKNIEWLAHFDVKSVDKKNYPQAKYKIKLSGSDNFVFWDGTTLYQNLNWSISSELTGDPAIGRL